MALGVTLIVVTLSVFLMAIGSPASEVSVSCFSATLCSKPSRIVYFPRPPAVVPLLMGMVVAIGLVKRSMILAWSGTILLLISSFFLGFSIGLFYLPLALALVGLVAIIQDQKRIL